VTFNVKWNKPVQKIIDKKVLKDGKTLKFMAVTWHRLYNKFVPWETGTLADRAVDHKVDMAEQRGIIHHKPPYAKFVYGGVTWGRQMVFSREKHPHASAQWDEAAKRAGLADTLAKDVEAYIRRGR